MIPETKELLRSIPSVSAMLKHEEVRHWLDGLPRASVVAAVRAAIETMREAISTGRLLEPVDMQQLLAQAEEELLLRSAPSLRPVINATGIVLHTGLGRAPLGEAAIEAIAEGAGGYLNLEYDLATGRRGKRTQHVHDLLVSLTAAESALVVNNNAAATLLILQTFADGKEVLVSRGQLIEIGGSFRLPDIFRASGAKLREVGTTNRTRIADYEGAVNDDTAMILRVHPSNYRIVGFTQDVPIGELAALAHRCGVIAVDDLGSGALVDLKTWGLPDEPRVADSLSAGADLACFSGDKLIGGPQCGIIVGKKDLIERIEANPLMRTYRVGKLILLALEATLRSYQDPDEAPQHVPTLAMLTASTEELALRARELLEQLEKALPDEHFFVCSDVGFAGGGSMPGRELQTVVVQWRPEGQSVESAASALRQADVPVIARIRNDAICLDLRTLRESDFDDLIASVQLAAFEDGPADESDSEPRRETNDHD